MTKTTRHSSDVPAMLSCSCHITRSRQIIKCIDWVQSYWQFVSVLESRLKTESLKWTEDSRVRGKEKSNRRLKAGYERELNFQLLILLKLQNWFWYCDFTWFHLIFSISTRFYPFSIFSSDSTRNACFDS